MGQAPPTGMTPLEMMPPPGDYGYGSGSGGQIPGAYPAYMPPAAGQVKEWSFYLHPYTIAILITKRFAIYFSFVLLYYLIQVSAAAGVVNFYSDADRHNSCNGIGCSTAIS